MSLASYHCSTPGSVDSSLLAKARSDESKTFLLRGTGCCLRLATAMSLEDPCRSELPELVPDHVFRHLQPHVLPAVVNQKGDADKFRHDGAIACPGLDRLI